MIDNNSVDKLLFGHLSNPGTGGGGGVKNIWGSCPIDPSGYV